MNLPDGAISVEEQRVENVTDPRKHQSVSSSGSNQCESVRPHGRGVTEVPHPSGSGVPVGLPLQGDTTTSVSGGIHAQLSDMMSLRSTDL